MYEFTFVTAGRNEFQYKFAADSLQSAEAFVKKFSEKMHLRCKGLRGV